jgi:hypothetical protein
VALIKWLILTERVSDALGSRKQKGTDTNAKIVDPLKHALDETKHCRDEQQRVDFHIALACVMRTGGRGQQQGMDKKKFGMKEESFWAWMQHRQRQPFQVEIESQLLV